MFQQSEGVNQETGWCEVDVGAQTQAAIHTGTASTGLQYKREPTGNPLRNYPETWDRLEGKMREFCAAAYQRGKEKARQ